MSLASLLEVRDLTVAFGDVVVVDGVSFSVGRGEALGLVGESGSGKSVTALALLGLVDAPGRIVSGSVRLSGQELIGRSEAELEEVRGRKIAMVFQEPLSALNPVLTIGEQVAEGVMRHEGIGRKDALARAEQLLAKVGVPAPAERLRSYPHQLSGGLRQRVLIATALACGPELLIADEPTTALDVSLQAQLIALFDRLRVELGMSLLFISHDLAVVAALCDQVAVMYAGQIVEQGGAGALFAAPLHPYSEGLIAALPELGGARLPRGIPGAVPRMDALPPGCRFAGRCPREDERCRVEPPPIVSHMPSRMARCFHPAGPAS